MGRIRIGMSGWTFPGWRGNFYPKGLKQKQELEYASRKVNSIEINGTFYGLQKPTSFQSWYDQTPEDFSFSVKGGQFLTHVLRVKGEKVNEALSNFFASGILCLRHKLGAFLWQFPPFVTLKDNRFETFAKLLPRDHKEMAKMAKKHTSRMAGRSFVRAEAETPIRHAFEFRHPSFMDPQFISMLRKNNIAIVFADSGKKSPYLEDLTADFVYCRLHGEGDLFKRGYRDADLKHWEARLRAWSDGKPTEDPILVSKEKPKKGKRDVFLYFDNDQKVYAPANAVDLIEQMGIAVGSDQKGSPELAPVRSQSKRKTARRPKKPVAS